MFSSKFFWKKSTIQQVKICNCGVTFVTRLCISCRHCIARSTTLARFGARFGVSDCTVAYVPGGPGFESGIGMDLTLSGWIFVGFSRPVYIFKKVLSFFVKSLKKYFERNFERKVLPLQKIWRSYFTSLYFLMIYLRNIQWIVGHIFENFLRKQH